ncbi:hypothetical protein KKC91_04525 [bacterium]|nr:hypothetical protein [bacterium]
MITKALNSKHEARNTKQYQMTKIQMLKTGFRISDLGFRICPNKNGIALIIVVSIMAVLASIAAAFSYSMIMDQRAAANYMNGIKADYVARAGIQHAIGVLKKDGDPSNQPPAFCSYEGYDWYGDDWGYDSPLFGINSNFASEFNQLTADSCVNNDDDIVSSNLGGMPAGSDSHWIYLKDSQGHLIGRYAVLVLDESGKININTAGYKDGSLGNEGWTTGEINIDPVCDVASVSGQEIINVRYGTDGHSGISGYDDNADSVILNNDGIDNDGDNDPAGTDGADEGDEGTDDSAEFYIASPYTDSSNLSADTPYLTPAEIVSLAGIDGDEYALFDSYITTFSSDKNLTDSGLARLNINAVSSAMELYSTLRDAFDYWGTSATTAELAQMAVNIIDFRDRDNGSTRIDIEDPTGIVLTRYGVEGIRINEVMVRPVFREDAPATAECNDDGSGSPGWAYAASTWTSQPTASFDTGIWSWSGITNGTYKVRIYGLSGGNVDYSVYPDGIGSWSDNTGKPLPDTTTGDTVVITGGIFKLNIKTANATDTWYRVDLSQSPDCEYVELVNISENAVTMDGWHLEFPNGQVGTIPSGTSIAAMGDSSGGDTIVLAIDRDDSTIDNGSEVYNNGIYFTNTYTSATSARVYQLGFTNDVLDDILCDTVLVDSPLRLYDGPIAPTTGNPAGHIVDQVLWDSQIIQDNDFYSMERNDPTYLGTDVLNDSGIFDTWLVYTGADRGTPTSANSNYSSSNTIKVKNSPFANIGEIADVSYSKTAWTNIGDTEARIKNIADRITISGRRLDAEFGYHPDSNWGSSPEVIPTSEIARSTNPGDLYWFKAASSASSTEDTWTWYTTIDRFEADTYIMYVYGREGGAMRVRVGNDTAIITPGTDYGARFGQVVVSDTTLNVALLAPDVSSDSTYFDYILLTPASKTYGRLNINTANTLVLQGLKDVDSTLANAIVGYAKPFHNIGEILDVTGIDIDEFKPISNLITTKSNVFKIICTGQSILDKNGNGTFDTDDEVLGERKITVIYER